MKRFRNEDVFVAYRLPGESHHCLLESSRNKVIPFNKMEEDNFGFVFHPFDTKREEALVLLPENIGINTPFHFESKHQSFPYEIHKNDYISLLNDYIYQIKNFGLHKAICSRIILKERESQDLYPLFNALKQQYPFAFVYLINIPQIGCWMGATPEILLTAKNQVGETVALAGTRPLNSPYDWTKKEEIEQQMVETYMTNILIQRKTDFYKHGPYTVRAGHVMHLKTTFRFPLENSWKSLAEEIHPSPAVCGLPKHTAMDFILENEPHERSYYCGFLGPVNIQEQTNLFVNLRCMQVMEDKFALYVGGGITSDSQAEKEWDETCWKSRTLSEIIEKVYEQTETVQ